MMRRIIISVLLFGLSLGFWGCARRAIKEPAAEEVMVPLSVLEQLGVEEAVSEDATLPLSILEQLDLSTVASFVPLVDKRPKEDIAYMTSVREKVSSKILDSLQSTGVFDKINFPANNDDLLMLTGEIRRFGWESFDTMISYIPGLNVLPFFGLPSTRVNSEVEIYLELKNAGTNEVIFKVSEAYSKSRKYNIYNFTQDKAEGELAYCFDVVLSRIKEKVTANRNKVFKISMVISLEAAKKRYQAEVAASGGTKQPAATAAEPKAPEKTGAEQPEVEIKTTPGVVSEAGPSAAAVVIPTADKIEGAVEASVPEAQINQALQKDSQGAEVKAAEEPSTSEGVPATTETSEAVAGIVKEGPPTEKTQE